MGNLALAQETCPQTHQHKVHHLTEFCLQHDGAIVPDPYYGGHSDFENVPDLIEDACNGLLLHVKRQKV